MSFHLEKVRENANKNIKIWAQKGKQNWKKECASVPFFCIIKTFEVKLQIIGEITNGIVRFFKKCGGVKVESKILFKKWEGDW